PQLRSPGRHRLRRRKRGRRTRLGHGRHEPPPDGARRHPPWPRPLAPSRPPPPHLPPALTTRAHALQQPGTHRITNVGTKLQPRPPLPLTAPNPCTAVPSPARPP